MRMRTIRSRRNEKYGAREENTNYLKLIYRIIIMMKTIIIVILRK
jgi:hypothetical protein